MYDWKVILSHFRVFLEKTKKKTNIVFFPQKVFDLFLFEKNYTIHKFIHSYQVLQFFIFD